MSNDKIIEEAESILKMLNNSKGDYNENVVFSVTEEPHNVFLCKKGDAIASVENFIKNKKKENDRNEKIKQLIKSKKK